MTTTLTIMRYRTFAIPMGILSMALFRIPLGLNRNIPFFKLMGSGKNGTFDKHPDWRQWAILCTHNHNIEQSNHNKNSVHFWGGFIKWWIHCFVKEHLVIILEPVAGHGSWDRQQVFGNLNQSVEAGQPIATLTRATIRLSKMNRFWEHVEPVASQMKNAEGLVFSIGIGEVPWIKQATFSVWHSADQMKAFAYKMKEHSEVIKKTRTENWYSEEMFVRFKITGSYGQIQGKNPLMDLFQEKTTTK